MAEHADSYVESAEVDGIVVVRPVGEFDISTVDLLREKFLEIISPATNRVVVDLAETRFVDSMAIGVMLSASRRVGELSGWVRVAAPVPQVRQVLELTGLDKVFGTFDTVAAALTAPAQVSAVEPA